jgi:hypothetical protein
MLATPITFATILSVVLAAPAMDLNKRDCQTEYLPTLWAFNSVAPNGMVSTPDQWQMLITRGSGPTKGFFDTVVEFDNIPTGAWGCQFELDYQPGHGGFFANYEGNAQSINVYAVDGDMPAEVTWESMEPLKGDLVGTFDFPTADELDTPTTIVINSFQCAPTMRFRLSMNEQSFGYIENHDDAISGLRITHNC